MYDKLLPQLRGKTDDQVRDFIRGLETDDSYHDDYYVSYGIIDTGKVFSSSPSRNDLSKVSLDDTIMDACFSDLPGMIEDCCDPAYIWGGFSLNPFEHFEHRRSNEDDEDYDYFDDDDYRDYDGSYFGSVGDLSLSEINSYCEWLLKHKLVPTFDVDNFCNKEVFVWDMQEHHCYSANTLYFSLTMMRYMHEGQNIVRRILALTKEFPMIDPFVAITIAHLFGDYNGGHSICDIGFWKHGQYGGDRWYFGGAGKKMPERYKKNETILYARIARALRIFVEEHPYDSPNDYGYHFNNLVGKCETAMPATSTPATWRGLLLHDTRRKQCKLNSEPIQNSSSKIKMAI